MRKYWNVVDVILESILKLIKNFTVASHPKINEAESIIIDWNNSVVECDFEEVIDAIKQSKSRVSEKEMTNNFENLSKFTKEIINYFQVDLHKKLNAKIFRFKGSKIRFRKIRV